MEALIEQDVPAYSVHDSLIVKVSDAVVAAKVFRQTIHGYCKQLSGLEVLVPLSGLVILSMGNERVDTSTATGKLILNMMVSVAQFEREMMKERQVEGIKRAQAEGKYKGRVPTAMKQADRVKALVDAGVTRVQVQEQLGISKASYYRCLKAS